MEEAIRLFNEKFGHFGELQIYFAPGRVNLIGEHTDYNGGFVFPCALTVGTYAVARKRSDGKIRMFSKNFSEHGVLEVKIGHLQYDINHFWANYPKGVIDTFQRHGSWIVKGFDVVYLGNIPNKAGLSSSASIELVTAVLLNDLFHLNLDMLTMVKLSQQAENRYIGVNCGIMDQFAIGMGKKDHAILLDCQTLDYTYSPVMLADLELIIANTNKSRGLADSKYNERRTECELALADLQTVLSVNSLGEVSVREFEAYKTYIRSDTFRKRAKHAVYENDRTKQAVQKMKNGDMAGLGLLMNQSHLSLRDDYEVSSKELDLLVEAAWKEGAIGARMTGAGFGGCTINIIEKQNVNSFKENVGGIYYENFGIQADFYQVQIGSGARKIS
ncbi:galactokinase [Bacillus sp. CMF12]|uniref:galactokinase n=1 Tax=Bacillaceae TaxID=186817 RepID=UPI001FB4E94E|nr:MULTISPECIES: galactokinase [Bacillaceae]UOE53728.1 galactokinase [Cytobacillus oceanisediminis]USK48172.1 galactokinase [Bacillus sp. CMF12]